MENELPTRELYRDLYRAARQGAEPRDFIYAREFNLFCAAQDCYINRSFCWEARHISMKKCWKTNGLKGYAKRHIQELYHTVKD